MSQLEGEFPARTDSRRWSLALHLPKRGLNRSLLSNGLIRWDLLVSKNWISADNAAVMNQMYECKIPLPVLSLIPWYVWLACFMGARAIHSNRC